MSDHHHHHRHRRRKSPISEFFDRLRGKKSGHSHHSSDFPGINLPKDYDPENYQDSGRQSDRESRHEERRSSQESHGYRPSEPSSSKKRKSIFGAFDLYLKKRDLRREERAKSKLRKQHRRKSEKSFKQLNKGLSLRKRLFMYPGEELEEVTSSKQIPLLSQRNPFYRNMTIIVNSTTIFIATYILTYLLYWLTCMLIASFYGLDSTLYYYDLRFNDYSPMWNRLNILIVTGLPPFICLILALFLFQYLFTRKQFVGTQKLFILWSAFHLFNHFFGAFPSGIVTDEGFGYVAAWLYLNTAFKFMFSLVSLFVLGAIGYFSAKHILETSDSYHRIKGDHRLSFILSQMAIPWLIGTIIILLLRIPQNFNFPYETLMFFTMAFLVIPPFFNPKVKPELNLLKIKKKRNINIGYLSMALALLLFLRIMLGIGLHFIIEIHISISPATV
jgi:hypothetical protein